MTKGSHYRTAVRMVDHRTQWCGFIEKSEKKIEGVKNWWKTTIYQLFVSVFDETSIKFNKKLKYNNFSIFCSDELNWIRLLFYRSFWRSKWTVFGVLLKILAVGFFLYINWSFRQEYRIFFKYITRFYADIFVKIEHLTCWTVLLSLTWNIKTPFSNGTCCKQIG